MGAKTAIEWCDHSFNPWLGCLEVSPGCDDCYARELARPEELPRLPRQQPD